MAEAFRALNWTPNEMVSDSKVDQMTANADDLFRSTPRAVYKVAGLTRSEGVRMASGRVIIGRRKNADSASATVRFGNYFTPTCEPIITNGIVSEHQTNIFATISGIGRLQPDAQGFQVSVNVAADKKVQDKIARSFYVTWAAMGY